ncbi:MAG TPA: lysophospholipid acyltransferase family protein [Polyangiaceae bacterium]|nr:lysophospholipid acyltransferase family protein [Polyangiaceae bacterium]
MRPPDQDRTEETEDDLSRDERISEDEHLAELGIGSRIAPMPPGFDAGSEWSEPAPEAAPLEPAPPPTGDVEDQIRALEARLDGLIRDTSQSSVGNEPPAPPEPSASSQAPDEGAAAASETVQGLLKSNYLVRQWGRAGMRRRSEHVDDFGLDPIYDKKLQRIAELVYRRYFRVEVDGIEHVPASGRCVIVANHSGTVPIDGAILKTAMRLDHPSQRDLRWLAEDFVFYLPFVGVFMNRIGAVRACRENAERLLNKDNLVAVFPEGIHGIRKLYSERYQLQRFGRGGFIRLCLRTGSPLVPAAIVGGEETNPVLYRLDTAAQLLGLPYLPVTPTFPWLGPLGLLPAPTKWKIVFGQPLHLDKYGPAAADDHVLVARLAEQVRSSIQGLLDRGLRHRQSVWFG